MKLLILGTSLFAAEVLDLAEDTGRFEIEGFVENLDPERASRPLAGLPVFWFDDARRFTATHRVVCSLGTTRRRVYVEQALEAGFRFATIVHPTARVSRRSSLAEGTIVSAGVVVAANTVVGRHVILNRGALLGHDASVGDYVTIGPGVNLAGATRIGDGSYLAIGATVLDRVSVGAGALVAAGALVTRDVPAGTEVRGAPAKVVREGVSGR